MTHDVPQVGEESLLVVAGMEPVDNVLGGVRRPVYTVRATSVEEGLSEHPARLQSSKSPTPRAGGSKMLFGVHGEPLLRRLNADGSGGRLRVSGDPTKSFSYSPFAWR